MRRVHLCAGICVQVDFTSVEVFATSPCIGTRLGVSGRSRTLDPGGISVMVALVSFTVIPVHTVTHQLDLYWFL